METSHLPAAEPSAPATTEADLRERLARMRAAQRRRPAPDCDERLAALDRLERALVARKSAFVAAISADFGHRSAHETLVGEVHVVLEAIRHTKAHLRDWMEPEEREVGWLYAPSTARLVPQPLGVVGVIAPWNYPLQLALWPLVSAVAAGNRVLLKPSELVPRTGALLRDTLAEAFSDDEASVVTGGPDVGEAFTRLPLDHLVFTGSTRVGRLVMRAASENLVPVTLELGGKSPAIVGADFSTRSAATRILVGKLFSAGQTCIAPDYALVPSTAKAAFVAACKAAVAELYPRLAANPDYTSIIDERHLDRLRRYVADARDRGAEVVEINPAGESFEGTRKMAPTLVVDPTDDMLVSTEEIFGPVLPVVPYAQLDDAIAYVNDRPRPLALYYFGHDRRSVDRVLAETTAGGVTVNETLLHYLQHDLPFGGVGPSGMGHYHGRDGFDTFTKKKPVFRQSAIGARALMRPPFGKLADAVLRALIR